MNFRTFRQALAIAAGTTILVGSSALAATITFIGEVSQQGTGFGTVESLLSLQASPNESGSVTWNGSSDVLTGDAVGSSGTQTAITVAGAGGDASGFFMIFQVNNTGSNPGLDLNDMSLIFQSPTGAILFTADFVDPAGTDAWDSLDGVGVGSSGYLFHVTFGAGEAATFFGNPNNRVGQEVTFANQITSSDDGPDNFFLAESDEGVPPSEVPEPTSLLLLGSGLVGLGAWRRKQS